MLSTVAGTTALQMHYLQDAETILESLSTSYLDVDPTGEFVLIDGFRAAQCDEYRADLWRLLFHRGVASTAERARREAGLGAV